MGSSPVNNFVPFVFWKSLSEHGRASFRLLFGGLSLNHVPCSTSNPSSMHKDVGSDPIYRCAESRKLPVHNDEIALCNDRSSLRRATEARPPNDPIRIQVGLGQGSADLLMTVEVFVHYPGRLPSPHGVPFHSAPSPTG